MATAVGGTGCILVPEFFPAEFATCLTLRYHSVSSAPCSQATIYKDASKRVSANTSLPSASKARLLKCIATAGVDGPACHANIKSNNLYPFIVAGSMSAFPVHLPHRQRACSAIIALRPKTDLLFSWILEYKFFRLPDKIRQDRRRPAA